MTSSNHILAGPHATPPAQWLYWVVEGQLLAGPYPGSTDPRRHRDKAQAIVDAGITTIICLMEEAELQSFTRYEETFRELAREQLHFQQFPIRDGGVPSPECMVGILDAIDDSIREGRPVYLHCWGGVGRTGTVVGCWLLRHGLATPDDVLAKLARLREQDRVRGSREAPETPEQRQFVRAWMPA